MTKEIKLQPKKTIAELVDVISDSQANLSEAEQRFIDFGKKLKAEIINEFTGQLSKGTYLINYGGAKNKIAQPIIVQVDNNGQINFVGLCEYVNIENNKGNYSVIDISSTKIRGI